ncbi:MAG: DUF4038 domain-containing protein [Treponema sp.]|jgi:hypothetical protein|nr:DUF4038 domain-containing protein [Treponema sp.]
MINDIERYDVFETRLPKKGKALFYLGAKTYEAYSFPINENEHAVRFMPHEAGLWRYTVISGADEKTGEFNCVPNTGNNHGPVRTEGFGFRYDDGTKFYPCGTTIYAWIHQTPQLIAQTLETLKKTAFNKVRMCVFPKHMPFNSADPALYPFHKDAQGKWDVDRPDFDFWDHLETQIGKLRALGIEADLILFHPYDRWGFSQLSREENMKYLDYCVKRLSAYRNIWWSIANEYDFVISKTIEDWDGFGEKLQKEDIYSHLISVHNGISLYPKRDWLSHLSVQSGAVDHAAFWRHDYGLPVIIDECGYEGNIEYHWGNLTAFELVHRAWTAVASGGFITHGETYWREDAVLWWAKGGKLYGESAERFAFLRKIQEETGDTTPVVEKSLALADTVNEEMIKKLPPEMAPFASAMIPLPIAERRNFMLLLGTTGGRNEDYQLFYYGRHCPLFADIRLPEDGSYQVDIIDTWEMTRKTFKAETHGAVRLTLPGKEGIAVLVKRLSGQSL